MAFKQNKGIIFCFLIISIFQCVQAQASPQKNTTAMQNEVLTHINQYRRHHGLSALKMNNKIVAVAKQHSMDMATHRVPFGHKYFIQRITKLRAQIKHSGAGAENVAYNYKDPKTVVEQWVLSPGHRRNIVGNYNQTGIGIVTDTKGKLYYTQIFLRTKP